MTTPRAGKYCPRCQTMTFLDREVCENCGHHFRTGADEPANSADSLHRTMQFTLPPLARREPPGLAPAPPQPALPRRGLWLFLALVAFCALATLAFLWQKHAASVPEASVSPVGTWESALTSRSSANAHLLFHFAPDGSGTFAWQEQGMGATGPSAASRP